MLWHCCFIIRRDIRWLQWSPDVSPKTSWPLADTGQRWRVASKTVLCVYVALAVCLHTADVGWDSGWDWDDLLRVCRNYTPSLEEYFETAIEQSDPAGGIEEQYKWVDGFSVCWSVCISLEVCWWTDAGSVTNKNCIQCWILRCHHWSHLELSTLQVTSVTDAVFAKHI